MGPINGVLFISIHFQNEIKTRSANITFRKPGIKLFPTFKFKISRENFHCHCLAVGDAKGSHYEFVKLLWYFKEHIFPKSRFYSIKNTPRYRCYDKINFIVTEFTLFFRQSLIKKARTRGAPNNKHINQDGRQWITTYTT